MTYHDRATYVGACDTHQKRLWGTRRAAKLAIRNLHDPGMREYACDVHPGHWHIGHLPPSVREGQIGIDEYNGRGAA